jgi:hypothetical protein
MSDAYDLAKASLETAFEPVAKVIDQIVGPAAEEFGLTLRDHIRVFRLTQQLKLFTKAKTILDGAGVQPKRIPLKLLAPILEHATLEDDQSLQDMWATLLANNAMGDSLETIFAEILRQLSPADALLLRNCFNEVMTSPMHREKGRFIILQSIRQWIDDIRKERTDIPLSDLSMENLIRLGLIETGGIAVNGVGGEPRLTEIGLQFMYACEDPAIIKAAEDEISKHRTIAHLRENHPNARRHGRFFSFGK